MIDLALIDKDFLRKLDLANLKEIYVKIISLTLDENPLAEISGVVQSGTVNVDGKSSVRRTCNIQMTADKNYSATQAHWALRTKFKLYIGVKNTVDKKYDDIIYFKMGTFVLTSFNATLNAQGYSISLQGKDKMCLLNGDISGSVFSETDFGAIWKELPDQPNRYEKTDIPIHNIIREAIHEYAGEPYGNIVINDLETCGVELLQYVARGNPIYVYELVERVGNSAPYSYTPQGTQICFEDSSTAERYFINSETTSYDEENQTAISSMTMAVGYADNFESNLTPLWRNDEFIGEGFYVPVNNSSTMRYHILRRADYMDVVGYRPTDLTYNGDLILKVGDSITSMLDKLVQMLGDFEYYYDLDGRFIFQRKKIYFNTSWSNAVVTNEQTYYDSTAYSSMNVYLFEGGQLVESYQHQPKLTAIHNDYSIWGSMKGTSDQLPVHLRYAIQNKPTKYVSEFRRWLNDTEAKWSGIKSGNQKATNYEWYTAWCSEHGYTPIANKATNSTMNSHWTALQENSTNVNNNNPRDWRWLIYLMAQDCFHLRGLITEISADINNPNYVWGTNKLEETKTILIALTKQYNKLISGEYAAYYTDLLGFLPYIYDYNKIHEADVTIKSEWQNNGWWNPEYFRYNRNSDTVTIYNPDGLVFWFDFLDATTSGLAQYSVEQIGRRPKMLDDSTVKSLFVRETPGVLFVNPAEKVAGEDNLKYARMNMPDIYQNYFSMSSQGKSAKEALDQLVYEGTYFNDTISLTTIPVYYLEPNTRIKVYDEQTGIDGDYLIDSLSYSLAYDGMLSIKATRAEERIL